MKPFTNILLLNIGIYAAYMLILYFLDAAPAAIVPIAIHSVTCFILSGTISVSGEGKKRRKAFLISGILILLIGIPACFFVGASTININ